MKKFKPFNLEDISKEELYDNLQRCISEKIDYWNRIHKAIEYINNHALNFNNEIETDLQVEEGRGKDNERNQF